MATFESDLGKVTAYAYAVDAGYQGTEAEFEEELLRAVSTFETDKTLAVENKAADAKEAGNIMRDISASIEGINSKEKSKINIVTPAGEYTNVGTAASIRKRGDILFVDGEIQYNNTRAALSGSELTVSTSQPSYDRRPNWYVDDLPFIIGHDYRVDFTIVSGSTAATEDMRFTIRDKAGTLNFSFGSGEVWTCTIKPEMLCAVLKQGLYSKCYYYITITDITKAEEESYESAGSFDYHVPAYFETQIESAVTKINTDINSDKTVGTYGTDIEAFVFITDVHWAANKKHSPGLIKRIFEKTPIRTVICGGDFIQSHNDTKEGACEEIREFTNAITGIPCHDYFAVFGNHDDNTNSGSTIDIQLTKNEQYNLMFAPFAEKANVHWIWQDDPTIFTEAVVKNDYYVDHPMTKTRFLCLDWNNPVSSKRTAWVKSVLEKNDNYRVIVIYHGFYAVNNGNLVEEHIGWMPVFEPYKGKIVAAITGHAHVDAVMDYYNDGSTPIILTSCDTFRSDRMQEYTTEEQCFDVVVVDYKNKIIKMTRIGRGEDRQVLFELD